MKTLKWLLVLLMCSALWACGGGGGNAGTSPFNQTCSSSGSASAASSASGTCPSSSATSVDVLTSSVQVGSGGDTATISAIVKGTGNVSLAAVPVSFSADSGTLTSAATVTDSSGVATATFSAGANRSNRTVNISVVSGSAKGVLSLQVVGTTLSYSGVTTVPLAGAVTVAAKATDSKGAVIPGVPVAVSSALNNGLSATTVTTDSQGTASVTYTALAAGSDTLSFSGLGTTVAPTLLISAANFIFTAPAAGTQIPVGTAQPLTVTYLLNGAPQAGQTVNFAATAGLVIPASQVTDGAGKATVSISSATASPAVVQATLVGPTVAQATVPIVFVAQTPAKVVLQVQPTAIGPNPATTMAQQAQLLATVTDANGNPVTGATVDFNRVADPSGGNLSQASAVTNSSGQASVQYIAGALTTANNGVVVQASISGAPGISGSAMLTVNQSALFIALGTGNTISNVDPQTYQKDWVVYVTDANGAAVPNINVTMKVLPLQYEKGTLTFQVTNWAYAPNGVVFCANEDANYNGILDPGEDFNGNGTLEPGNVISVSPASVTTDATGRATVSLFYAESYAPWVTVKLQAQAVVSGTESSKSAVFTVGGVASDFNSSTIPPAGVFSPFGVALDCANPN